MAIALLVSIEALMASAGAQAGTITGAQVNDDVWYISGGYDRDAWTISVGGRLTNNGEIAVFNTRTGPGWYPDWGVTLDNQGELLNAGTLTLDRGVYDFYGMRRRPGRMTNSGLLQNSGTFSNSGTFDNQSRGTLDNQSTINSSGTLNNASLLTNAGALNIVAEWFDSGYGYHRGVLNNLADGTLSNAGTLDSAYGTLNNAGTLRSSGTLSLSGYTTLNNSGILENSGSMSNGSYCTIDNTGYLYNYGTLRNYNGFGIVQNDWPVFTPFHDTISNSAFLYNFGTIDNFDRMVNKTNAEMTNLGTLNIAPSFGRGQWYPAWFDNYGWLRNSGTIDNADTLNNYGGLNNDAGATLRTRSVMVSHGTVNNHGTLDNEPGGTLQNFGALNNHGVFRNGGTVQGAGYYQQFEGVTINNGSVSQADVAIRGGRLSGTGTFEETAVVLGADAELSPGDPLGALTIDGVLVSYGDHLYEIAGLDAGKYDVLDVNGRATFSGGDIRFGFIHSFRPKAGDFWDFLLADSIVGWETLKFDAVGLADGYEWRVDDIFGGKRFVISASPVPVPNPGTILMLAPALLGLAASRKRPAH